MDQSNKIFAAIFIAFIVYITMKGELPVYLTFIRGGGAQPTPSSASGASNSSGQSFGVLGDIITGKSDGSPGAIFTSAIQSTPGANSFSIGNY